ISALDSRSVERDASREAIPSSAIRSGWSWRSIHRSSPIARTASVSPGRGPKVSRLRAWTIRASSSTVAVALGRPDAAPAGAARARARARPAALRHAVLMGFFLTFVWTLEGLPRLNREGARRTSPRSLCMYTNGRWVKAFPAGGGFPIRLRPVLAVILAASPFPLQAASSEPIVVIADHER